MGKLSAKLPVKSRQFKRTFKNICKNFFVNRHPVCSRRSTSVSTTTTRPSTRTPPWSYSTSATTTGADVEKSSLTAGQNKLECFTRKLFFRDGLKFASKARAYLVSVVDATTLGIAIRKYDTQHDETQLDDKKVTLRITKLSIRIKRWHSE